MENISILLFFEKYIITKGLSEIIKEINPDIKIVVSNSFDKVKTLILNNNFDFLLIENINFERYFNNSNNLEQLKIIVFGEYNKKINSEILVFDYISKNISKDDIYTKFNDLFISDSKIDNNLENNIISKREKEIVQFVALGYSNKEIADKLFLSIHTVTTHRKNISKKLGIKTISGLTIYAILNDIISINDKKV
ncbi:MAG: helix-turn-helix transcriptional regulator [Bacteroidota bacterium]|nr:helix-turn-helix transcriptional regulator [Bacteroidota bacterium]